MSAAREAVRTAYSGRSAEYIDLFGSIDAADDRDRQRVERWADGLDGPVLDAGCGPGHWTHHLAARGIAFRVAHPRSSVRDMLQREGLGERLRLDGRGGTLDETVDELARAG